MPKARRRVTSRTQRISDANPMPLGDQPWWVRAGAYVGVPTLVLAAVFWWVDRKFDQHVVDTAVLVRHLEEETQRGWQTVSIFAARVPEYRPHRRR
jgi:hypothetical protein